MLGLGYYVDNMYDDAAEDNGGLACAELSMVNELCKKNKTSHVIIYIYIRTRKCIYEYTYFAKLHTTESS